jgi:hypothetical protein
MPAPLNLCSEQAIGWRKVEPIKENCEKFCPQTD